MLKNTNLFNYVEEVKLPHLTLNYNKINNKRNIGVDI